MGKLIKIDFLLKEEEVNKLRDFIRKNKGFDFKKNIKVDVLEMESILTLYIYRRKINGDIRLELEFISDNIIEHSVKFKEVYPSSNKNNNQFIGVKSLQIENLKKKEKIKLLININIEKNTYKTDCLHKIERINSYIENKLIVKKQMLLNELAFNNFEGELEMILCSYLLIKEGKSIL